MRQTLMMASLAMLTACGATGDRPWDENRDGLITACEGLNPNACDATPGCEPVAIACAAICAPGPNGDCDSPCVGGETCRPTPIRPTFDCTQLSLSQCVNDSRCAVAQLATATSPSTGGAFAPPAEDRVDTRFCVNRPPSSCESLSADACLARPGCALIGTGTGTGNHREAADVAFEQPTRCITLPTPDFCEARDANTCTLDGRCVLESTAVCEVFCAPGTTCPPCATPSPRCVAPRPPDLCGARDLNSCSFDGRCVVESGPVCDAICDPNGNCPPCANPSFFCVPATPPDFCGSRDRSTCELDGYCVMQSWACPAICKPDGHGGCEPCNAPPDACVPVNIPLPIDLCNGLDRASCTAAGCQLEELACTLECRDDGDGGCVPCDAFICTSGGSIDPDVDGGRAP